VRTDELDFDLPRDLIATHPADPRDSARLLVVRSRAHEHRSIRDLPEILTPNDTLVFNSTRVLPARFRGVNASTGGKVEGLWLADAPRSSDGGARWAVLLKARRHRAGAPIDLLTEAGSPTGVRLTILGRASEAGVAGSSDDDGWLVEVTPPDAAQTETTALLERAGMTPLPPYILSRRKELGETVGDELDRRAYQTIFAGLPDATSDGAPVEGAGDRRAGPPDGPVPGSVAAPTAGLHFTPRVLSCLDDRGVARAQVTLHVGAGTFKPVEVDDLSEHPMHAEWCTMDDAARRAVFGSPERRVVAVGSTSTRTVESFAIESESAGELPEWLSTRLLIAPGHRWRRVGGILTNFHLPRSTLLAIVAAIVPGGIERTRELYAEAVRERYRFFSYGDAMLILPD
jgi:S-adenosylmethionine:tRNA ribosyltransferase-isomerase